MRLIPPRKSVEQKITDQFAHSFNRCFQTCRGAILRPPDARSSTLFNSHEAEKCEPLKISGQARGTEIRPKIWLRVAK